jgi:hypothetical protein
MSATGYQPEDRTSTRCTDCGTTVPAGSTFCDSCGHPLRRTVPATVADSATPPNPPTLPPPPPSPPRSAPPFTQAPAPEAVSLPSERKPVRRRVSLIAALVGAATLLIVGVVLALSFLPPDQESPTETVRIEDLMTGDCLRTPSYHAENPERQRLFWERHYGNRTDFTVVPCAQPHGAQVIFAGDLWDAAMSYPGDAAIDHGFWSACEREFRATVGAPPGRVGLEIGGWIPDAATWAQGDRGITCLAFDPEGEDLRGPLTDSR